MSEIERIQIVGCGVIGLTTGIVLQQRTELPVEIVARELPPHTTSNIAAAVWLPFQVEAGGKTLERAARTREIYESQMNDPETGVFETELMELFPVRQADPDWVLAVKGFRHATGPELPAGYLHGVVARVPMIDTPVYLPWLVREFQKKGGAIREAVVHDLDGISDRRSLMVNCTGLGARNLCGDETMFPVRGQIARLDVSGYSKAMSVETGPDAIAYLLPRRNEVIAGGTTGRGDWNRQVDPETAGLILAKAVRLDSRLANARVIEHLVGLRPGRPTIRLECEERSGGRLVIHNYGHGGAGFTLAWGCAEEVAELVAGC